jgi:mycothiol synthase
VTVTTTTPEDLHPADAPAIPGLRFRRLRDEADYAAIAELLAAGSLAHGLDFVPDAASIQVDLENDAGHDPHKDLLLVEVDGRFVGYGQASRTVRDGLAVYTASGSVHPDWRRRGLGRSILRATERRLREKASSCDDAAGRVLGSWIGEKESGAPELLTAEGYVPVRYFFSMIRPHLEAIPDAPLPGNLEIREVRPGDMRVIFDAENDAFRDHWGHRELGDEDFAQLTKQPDLDTSLWSVAWDHDQVVGSVQVFIWRAENEALGVRRGSLERVSVRRPWRRLGVATAMISDSLRRLKAAGMNEAILGVDAESTTGALRLYESLGFKVKDRGIAYRMAMACRAV